MNDPIINSFKNLISSKCKDKMILEDQYNYFTCEELFFYIKGVFEYLNELNIQENEYIGVYRTKDIYSIAFEYALYLYGAIFVPLDIANPTNRINSIISNLKIKYLFVNKYNKEEYKSKKLFIPDKKQCIENGRNKDIKIHSDSSSIALILHTSGSSGKPKPIAISKKAICSFVKWSCSTFNITEKDIIGNQAPLHFDLSLFDIYVTLIKKCKLSVIPRNLITFPKEFKAWLLDKKITILYTVPSIVAHLTKRTDVLNIYLKYLLLAGEKVSPETVFNINKTNICKELYNLFGPTETNVCCYWKVDLNYILKNKVVPIGKPTCNSQLELSEDGELKVKGDSLFSGYIEDNNLLECLDKDGMYNTGDICSINPDGLYLFHGRNDRMIKKNGFRIAAEEIETAILKINNIKEAHIIYDPDKNKIILLYTGSFNKNITDLKRILLKDLPHYMLPDMIEKINFIPFLSNGKKNIKALEQMMIKK